MARSRGSTTPMDFEWDNSQGPIDENSPFITGVPAKKRKLDEFALHPNHAQPLQPY